MQQSVPKTAMHHPTWCDVEDHSRFVEESDGLLEAAEVATHYRSGGNSQLSELVNAVGRRTEREGGGGWSLQARQALLAPYTDAAGYASAPLVHLTSQARDGWAVPLTMTTGEARVLAAHLVALCDLVDLAEVRQRS